MWNTGENLHGVASASIKPKQRVLTFNLSGPLNRCLATVWCNPFTTGLTYPNELQFLCIAGRESEYPCGTGEQAGESLEMRDNKDRLLFNRVEQG